MGLCADHSTQSIYFHRAEFDKIFNCIRFLSCQPYTTPDTGEMPAFDALGNCHTEVSRPSPVLAALRTGHATEVPMVM